jgi:hypothetical protein
LGIRECRCERPPVGKFSLELAKQLIDGVEVRGCSVALVRCHEDRALGIC